MRVGGNLRSGLNLDRFQEQVLLMKMVFVGLSLTMLLSTAGSALSQAKPDSLRMTCNQARAFVAAAAP